MTIKLQEEIVQVLEILFNDNFIHVTNASFDKKKKQNTCRSIAFPTELPEPP